MLVASNFQQLALLTLCQPSSHYSRLGDPLLPISKETPYATYF